MRALHSESPAWCPGCGNFSILPTLDEAIEEVGLDRRRLVLVSGIGQAAKLPHYTRANVFNGLHGRALPPATAIKLVNHELEVVVTSGDGDMYGEGGNHFIHAIRRNIGVKCFVHNNQVYGLTKGQASPTSDPGMETPIQTHGVMAQPFNPLAVAIVEGASFVARSCAVTRDHLKEMMVAALKHDGGFTLLDILQPCPSFNKRNTAKWYKERVKPIADDHDPTDMHAALDLAMTWGDQIPIGILYRNERPPFESLWPALEKGPLVEQYSG
ncbi:MAG: 2-oxoacid:ferredoxin oxidoreductase subunit beta [candidate division WS1 bacterium]|jgi:2-oxoglutarate ferredoxin oxidoreductase subunit beta|nr:2-oxoacid:ferredoxin oxidoreductase subunit beta [candidate division WS1 bacterium]